MSIYDNSMLPKILWEEIKLKNIKNMIFGLQGSGKTFLAKELCKKNNLKVLVYSPHIRDFENEPNNFIYYRYKNFYDDYDEFLKISIELGKAKEIDLVLIDEYDMLSKSGKTLSNLSIDFTANHRHYHLGALYIARRPQDIDTFAVESCEFLIGFSIFGDNVKLKLNRIYSKFGDMVQSLQKEEHKCIVLQIGKEPKIMDAIK